MKKSIRTIAPVFSARRMVKEYFQKMYLPAVQLAGIAGKTDET